MTFELPDLADPTAEECERFDRDGFLVLPGAVDIDTVEHLRKRFEPLFRGEFETGNFPDEWHWREGISYPDATRHMSNCWKSDLTMARWVLSEAPGRFAARLAGWPSIRLALDTLWWKTPKAKAIALHQDTSFLDYLEPRGTMTCWLTLDDTHADGGTIEYVAGSHRWPVTPLPRDFHDPDGGYRARMLASAEAAGISEPRIVPVEAPAGSLVFHHGEIWHGSGPNARGDVVRRSIGMHLLPGEVRFGERGGGYVLGRYRRAGERSLDESHFPVLWSDAGSRTAFIEHYCESGVLP